MAKVLLVLIYAVTPASLDHLGQNIESSISKYSASKAVSIVEWPESLAVALRMSAIVQVTLNESRTDLNPPELE